jgi:hypothetical protein
MNGALLKNELGVYIYLSFSPTHGRSYTRFESITYTGGEEGFGRYEDALSVALIVHLAF